MIVSARKMSLRIGSAGDGLRLGIGQPVTRICLITAFQWHRIQSLKIGRLLPLKTFSSQSVSAFRTLPSLSVTGIAILISWWHCRLWHALSKDIISQLYYLMTTNCPRGVPAGHSNRALLPGAPAGVSLQCSEHKKSTESKENADYLCTFDLLLLGNYN